MNRIIEDFSYLRKTNCKGVYLDNAATTLCPDEVIDYMSEIADVREAECNGR